MNLNLAKEQLSLAHIRAIAASAGYQVVRPEVDNDSIDGAVFADRENRARLEFQAKSTSQFDPCASEFNFPLSAKNYDDLRAEVLVPRILIIVLIPEDVEQWIVESRRDTSGFLQSNSLNVGRSSGSAI